MLLEKISILGASKYETSCIKHTELEGKRLSIAGLHGHDFWYRQVPFHTNREA